MADRTSVSSTAAGSSSNQGNNNEKLFLFDFDGVVCDSCDECTVSALRTCQKLGAALVLDGDGDGDEDYPPSWLFERMRAVRPAIYVGWQIPVLLAAIVEQHQMEKNGGPSAMSDEEIITNYETIVTNQLSKWGKTDNDMIEVFGGVRDEWIANDLPSWLDINGFYPGVPESLNACRGEGVLVTTKQQRFAVALVRHAGVGPEAMPDDDIYGLGMYKGKADVIAKRMIAGGYQPENTFFFEDRWPTLAKCLKDERLDGVNLCLCSWGYVTPAEREMAEAESRVRVLDLEEFAHIVTSHE
jgi:phosphoglycolate phosphatase-like HAD superfamily hydrolase